LGLILKSLILVLPRKCPNRHVKNKAKKQFQDIIRGLHFHCFSQEAHSNNFFSHSPYFPAVVVQTQTKKTTTYCKWVNKVGSKSLYPVVPRGRFA